MVSQWRKAFRRQSSMNSGSFFLAEMSRMTSSFRPRGTVSVLDVGDEPVLVLAVGQLLECFCGSAHETVLNGKSSGCEWMKPAISGSLRSKSLSFVLCSACCTAWSMAIQSERIEQSLLRTQARSTPLCL